MGAAVIEKSDTSFDPEQRMKVRPGLYVYEPFITHVRSRAQVVVSAETLELPYFSLKKPAHDREISTSVPLSTFSETAVCYIIDALMSRQSQGEKGDLEVNGYGNLFYLESTGVVTVHWYAARRRWRVYRWFQSGYRWHRGSRVFSCS